MIVAALWLAVVLAAPLVLSKPASAQDVVASPGKAPAPVPAKAPEKGPEKALDAVPGKVQVQSLGAVEPFQVGARGNIAFAVSTRQWRAANARVAAQLISSLPEAGASPLLNQLVTSVLLSPSEPPPGGKADAALASLRLGSVYRMGQLEAVIDLAERSPGGLSDPENAAIATRAFLALGRDGRACETASRLKTGRAAVFWLKVRAFCQARRGHAAAAQLSADLAMEADPEDADFLLALNHMLNKDTSPVQPINALELAMARFAGAPVKLDGAPLALVSAMARAPGATGIAAARRLGANGLLPTAALARLYLAWPEPEPEKTPAEPPQEPAPPAREPGAAAADAPPPEEVPEDKGVALLARAQEAKGPARAALFYQSAVHSADARIKSDAIAGGLELEKTFAGFVFAARLYGPLLQALPPDAVEAPARRRLFAYALLAARRMGKARAFVPPDDADMTRLLAIFSGKPLSAMGTLGGDSQDDMADKANDEAQARQIYIDLMALSALHRPLQAAHRTFLFAWHGDAQDFAPCPAGARAAIREGAQMKSRAATMVRAALMLADSGFDQAAPECGAAVIGALDGLGYGRAARRGALEMMLGPRWRRMQAAHE